MRLNLTASVLIQVHVPTTFTLVSTSFTVRVMHQPTLLRQCLPQPQLPDLPRVRQEKQLMKMETEFRRRETETGNTDNRNSILELTSKLNWTLSAKTVDLVRG
mmetsp:Transcript_766/g.1406  ORF Transcript_766/g.1406 Transcript_766/m.1406 type:complete len:103 (+) Transcript_766:829-1137(+)